VPPLEINQSHYINASVRLDESIAAQFAQYAAFTRASADDFADKALDYVLSKDCDLADFLKTPQAKQADTTLRICKGASKDAVSIRDAGLHPVRGHWGLVPLLGGWILDSIRDGTKTVLRTGRIVTLHPWEGTVGKPTSALGEPSWHPIDGVFRGSVRKPVYTCVKTRVSGGLSDGAAR
jgi:hypothetical protein